SAEHDDLLRVEALPGQVLDGLAHLGRVVQDGHHPILIIPVREEALGGLTERDPVARIHRGSSFQVGSAGPGRTPRSSLAHRAPISEARGVRTGLEDPVIAWSSTSGRTVASLTRHGWVEDL